MANKYAEIAGQIELMIAWEDQSPEGERSGSMLMHWAGTSQPVSIDLEGLKVLHEYYQGMARKEDYRQKVEAEKQKNLDRDYPEYSIDHNWYGCHVKVMPPHSQWALYVKTVKKDGSYDWTTDATYAKAMSYKTAEKHLKRLQDMDISKAGYHYQV